MAGTFYRSPAPGPLVKVGDKVQKGQVLCIIEAMKMGVEVYHHLKAVRFRPESDSVWRRRSCGDGTGVGGRGGGNAFFWVSLSLSQQWILEREEEESD